ncbi:hypothetical protein EYF80_006695 [Liparis tanakae]|uniref:Uncharacterized protein n=1 Tax=Liparis tanakae TaxID=230148 RepID=A0A4Z2J083_9TELE|nr:hypothetical protein EYF80_006695 [Liparis tanakae]
MSRGEEPGCLEELAMGREKGRPHRRFTAERTVCLRRSANPVSHFADYAHFPDRTGDTPQGEAPRSGVFTRLPCLNNDVAAVNRGARYSPRSFLVRGLPPLWLRLLSLMTRVKDRRALPE